MKVTEDNIVQQIKHKNEESITFILQTYGGLLNGIIRKYISCKQDREECLEDVLISIWFHIDSFDPDKNSFKQWGAAIAKYRAIDYLRKAEKARKHMSSFGLGGEFSTHRNEMPYDLDRALQELSNMERQIFRKYYMEGVPSKEIATEFQAKESWVHNKLSRGRKKLKKLLLKNEV
ncbi:sigma-70 family RNA polymerase sigma factor [Bacillus sp. 2205SS5-2]|uniref:sigma-70 family RNA polymerase sigma factor n=1 Tax=Bacillus sp. 2205SS5-2 TaxID=3109031 RepID=UPI003007E518